MGHAQRAALLLLTSVAVVGSTGDGAQPAKPPPWSSSWDTCAAAYARNLSAVFPRHSASEILAKLPPPTEDHPAASAASPLILLAPGSSGTASFFWASAMLNLSAKHFNDVWLHDGRCSRTDKDKAYLPEALFTRGCGGRGCEFVGDWPVPVQWPRLWALAPRARFVMLDFDAAKWRASRLSFRGGYCSNSPLKGDCRVPLAFDAVGGKWEDASAAVASVNQTVAAADALKAFVRCAIPADQLVWLSWQMPPPRLWALLSGFARVPLPPTLDRTEFPRDRNGKDGKRCAFGNTTCGDMLACVLGDLCAGCRKSYAHCSKRRGGLASGGVCPLDFKNPYGT